MKLVYKCDSGFAWRKVYRFPNNYGLSVYSGDSGKYSVGIIRFTTTDSKTWDVPLNGDVTLSTILDKKVYGNERFTQDEYQRIIELVGGME